MKNGLSTADYPIRFRYQSAGRLGPTLIIAVNLNGDLLGRRFASELPLDATLPPQVSNEFLAGVLKQLPPVLGEQATQIVRRLLPQRRSTPGYFQVLANSINIMQDYVTRARLAGEPPHVMLAPRLRDIGLMEYNRATEAIAEGRYCVEQAMPMLRRYCCNPNVCYGSNAERHTCLTALRAGLGNLHRTIGGVSA